MEDKENKAEKLVSKDSIAMRIKKAMNPERRINAALNGASKEQSDQSASTTIPEHTVLKQ